MTIRYFARAGRFGACLPLFGGLYDTPQQAQAALCSACGIAEAGEYAQRLRERGAVELTPAAFNGCEYALVETVEMRDSVAYPLGLAITPGEVHP